jgi:hypothetical protein
VTDDIARRVMAGESRFSTLAIAVVKSPPFQNRKGAVKTP